MILCVCVEGGGAIQIEDNQQQISPQGWQKEERRVSQETDGIFEKHEKNQSKDISHETHRHKKVGMTKINM